MTNRPQWKMRTTHLTLAIQNEMCSLMILQARLGYANIQANEREAQMMHAGEMKKPCMDQKTGQLLVFQTMSHKCPLVVLKN